ncbi:hypothetical protein H310_14166 [Aphanomyces invadans]|uniref:Uncharacterized protein n=1 Tax=Aphanomyces invadans TaxID=157072 RepID=A0A024TAH7_9STRA|nr:hypothetical protein H310_14166 [Aphanomyces invadans]ETV91155.1 hypothetical protein H310_14166 [Aphanomyces invadans]|eukprot:XP_008880186.1 hypothetical protein H310_14166 [Aphanomyces invadans]
MKYLGVVDTVVLGNNTSKSGSRGTTYHLYCARARRQLQHCALGIVHKLVHVNHHRPDKLLARAERPRERYFATASKLERAAQTMQDLFDKPRNGKKVPSRS